LNTRLLKLLIGLRENSINQIKLNIFDHPHSKMNFGDRRAEAQSIFKEATKLSAPSFLGMRLKGDWIQATPMFERAALLFRVSSNY
jgi:hypothetical protein